MLTFAEAQKPSIDEDLVHLSHHLLRTYNVLKETPHCITRHDTSVYYYIT